MREDLAAQRRNEILEASARLFAEKGYHATNIADIAAEMGIGHGTFYRYFRNKLDIFEQVIGEIIERISQVVMRERADEADTLEEYREQLYRIGDGLVEIIASNPIAVRVLFYESLGIDEQINKMIHRAFDLFGAYTQAYLENGMRKGFLRKDIHPREAALAVNSMLLEAARRIVTAKQREAAKRKWTDTIIRLMLDGLRAEDDGKR
jgi:AcrR family transcriptional regulator